VDSGENGKTRLDADTWPKAFAYLKANKPRFLYISLNDADERGHAGDYSGYLKALRQYDAWLVELVAALDAMGDYGANTTLIVTTDHGRGLLWDWRNHGGRPMSRRVWMYARHPRMSRKGLTVLGGSHVDLRPTIEKALGLAPFTGSGSGDPLKHVLAR
jgi:phosphopentomutase